MITKERKKELDALAETIARDMTVSELDALIAWLERSLKNPPKTKKG